MPRCLLLIAALLFFTNLRSEAAIAAHVVSVHARSRDHLPAPLHFTLPPGSGPHLLLQDEQGRAIDLQFDPAGQAHFIQDALQRGQTVRYRLIEAIQAPAAREAAVDCLSLPDGTFEVRVDRHPLFRYHAGKSPLPRPGIKAAFQRGGYLHPIFTPARRVVSDDYATNHLHQHGIWAAWTKTSFDGRAPDFWNMGEGKGTVEALGITARWSGPVYAGFQSAHRFIDLLAKEPAPALDESWTVSAYRIQQAAGTKYWMFDLTSTQTCVGPLALELPKYHYGGFGFRGAESWNNPAQFRVLTSEGLTNRLVANTSRARWCDLAGNVGGQIAGIAILSHPENFRAPQPIRVHPNEPFLCFAPQQLGDMRISPGSPYISRYRFIVHDGSPIPADLDRFWADFADPPAVEIEVQP